MVIRAFTKSIMNYLTFLLIGRLFFGFKPFSQSPIFLVFKIKYTKQAAGLPGWFGDCIKS
jgi:hypothetical protein